LGIPVFPYATFSIIAAYSLSLASVFRTEQAMQKVESFSGTQVRARAAGMLLCKPYTSLAEQHSPSAGAGGGTSRAGLRVKKSNGLKL
jgi:hypothetical protein